MSETKNNVYRLDKISGTKLAELDRSRTMVMVAISPLEVHGPHLPIGQDWYEAQAIAEQTMEAVAAQRKDWNFIIMPPVPVSIDCIPHMGSVNFPVRVVEQLAYYTLRPFAQHGFARLAYSSFHGSPRHNCALEAAAEKLTKRYGVPVVSVFSAIVNKIVEGDIFYDAVKDSHECPLTLSQTTKDTHAGFVETSLGLHMWPELVDSCWKTLPPRTKIPEEEESRSFLYNNEQKSFLNKIENTLERVNGIREALKYYRTNTYCGYPAKSSAEMGNLIMDHVTGVAKETLLEFIEKGSEMETHSPLWKLKGVFLNGPLNYVMDNILKIND